MTADNLMKQYTLATDDPDARPHTMTTQNSRLSNKTKTENPSLPIDNDSHSLDIDEIAELMQGAADQGKGGTMKVKSKAQKKLDHEKAVQRQ